MDLHATLERLFFPKQWMERRRNAPVLRSVYREYEIPAARRNQVLVAAEVAAETGTPLPGEILHAFLAPAVPRERGATSAWALPAMVGLVMGWLSIDIGCSPRRAAEGAAAAEPPRYVSLASKFDALARTEGPR